MLQKNNTEIDVAELSKKIDALKVRTAPVPDLEPQSSSVADNMNREAHDCVDQTQTESGSTSAANTSSNANSNTDSQRMQGSPSPDLGWRQRLSMIPLVGTGTIWLSSILRLNTIRHKIALDFDQVRMQAQRLQDQITQQQAQLQAQSTQLQHAQLQITELRTQLSERLVQLENLSLNTHIRRIDFLGAANAERENRMASLVREVRDLHAQRVYAGEHAGEPSNTTHSSAATPTRQSTVSAGIDEIDVPGLDSFYVEFEDNFRGTAEDITARLSIYLPYLNQFSGDASATVVDIGCGRGEWLRLLKNNHINALGIDMNEAMVETCQEQGLSAVCQDAIAYLRQQPEASLAAITGFHIIEHLPFKVLLSLFDAALHALRPDGLIIFETPNPENLTVGACNFYFDPTHRNPIVPAVAQFMAKQRGFAKADILRLHPYPDEVLLVEDSELAVRVNRALYCSQDFAVIAWKTHAN